MSLATTRYVRSLTTTEDSLELLGGKGRSLVRMTRAGFAVPDGFLITTSAYRDFVEETGLQSRILELARPELVEGRVSFESASQSIRRLFADVELPEPLVSEATDAYRGLATEEPALAVRSSANAEDLPDLSFAGQQETYLNVRGASEVLAAIKNCWASLWTAQALTYRHQNGIDPETVAMAVVAQIMVPSEVSGILFTANPATGERSELIVEASFGLGESVVGGHVTPDSFVLDWESFDVKASTVGPKEHRIVSDGEQGTRQEEVSEDERQQFSLGDDQLRELAAAALEIEALYGAPQDIEWAFAEGQLWLLQSRPITNLPPQPIEVEWVPEPPAQILARRQIIENVPDPCTPLFEELYLTEGLETVAKGKKREPLMVGGGPMFVTLNGYGYQRFDWPQIIEARKERLAEAMSEAEMDAAEIALEAGALEQPPKRTTASDRAQAAWEKQVAEIQSRNADMAQHDLDLFLKELSSEERRRFESWAEWAGIENLAALVTQPESKNPTFGAFNRTQINEKQIQGFYGSAVPDLLATCDEWQQLDPEAATDDQLLEGVCELAIAGGMFWSANGGHTFGVAKSTDDQLQAFLREALPEHHFTSGQFLSGFRSKTMEANEHLFEIAQQIRAVDAIAELVLVTPSQRLMTVLREHPDAQQIAEALDGYLEIYGHLAYSLDFAEPLPLEDPSGLLASLKTMVADRSYDPKNHEIEAKRKREKAMEEILGLLEGLPYWQFRFRLWFTHRFYAIREEVMFYLYKAWPVLRPLALELGRRLTERGSLAKPDHVFYLVSDELREAIEAGSESRSPATLRQLAVERFELREARKRLHPPGTVPFDASEDPSVAFKETQFVNDPSSDKLKGVPVSPGRVTGPVSVIHSPAEFDQMQPGSILVCTMTNPAWTPLFAHAIGLVTDIGGILGHGSIVAREYGIPAVVGTGNVTRRLQSGQRIEVDGDAGIVTILSS